jgi:hypothetical protein
MRNMFKLISEELKHHVPFTAIGSATGVVLMVAILMANALQQVNRVSETVFYILHPAHVTFSAIVITSMYRKYRPDRKWQAVIIGYLIAVTMATLSDSLIPYLGEAALNLPNRELHIGFLEEWWLVNPAAALGIAIAFIKPTTKLPHSAHVLISTWASLFHIIMALGVTVAPTQLITIFVFLFIAVWVPCCLSDIALPLVVVGKWLPHDHT